MSNRSSSPIQPKSFDRSPIFSHYGSSGGEYSSYDDGEGCLGFFILFLVIGIPITLTYIFKGKEIFWYSLKMLLLIICLTFIPTISSKISKNALIKTLCDVVLFSICILGSLLLFGISLTLSKVLFIIFIILLIEVGGLINLLNINYTINNIKNYSSGSSWNKAVYKVQKMMYYGEIVYLLIPLTLLIGTIIGVIIYKQPSEILHMTTIISVITITTALLVFSIIEFVRICHPYCYMKLDKTKVLENKINDACVITDLRKIYLLDSVHSVMLIVVFSIAIIKTLNLVSLNNFLIFSILFLVLSLVFNQFPYIVGQYHLRKILLKNIIGLKKEETLETMDKYAPLFPFARYITVATMTGTAGYFIFKLFEKFIVDLLGIALSSF